MNEDATCTPCGENQLTSEDKKDCICDKYKAFSPDKSSCIDPSCLDNRNKILEDGTCEKCGDYEEVAEDKISCIPKECDLENREIIEIEATCK